VAIATPPGRGAIAIVRISGPNARQIERAMLRARRPLLDHHATLVAVHDETGTVIDRGLAIFAPAPHSYTGEDTLELQVHGSPVVAREVVRAVMACGARYARPGEFTRRAFLSGKLDLHGAGAVADLIDAESRSAARAALANLGGGLADEVRALRGRLAKLLEELAAAIDFPDEVADPDPARLGVALGAIVDELQRLRREGERGRLIREGVPIAIVGPPNAGKSSLLNALLGSDRAIVSEVAGTTRDTIEEALSIDGVVVRLVDTAGIRAHADRIEAAGIERTNRALNEARIALIVLDGSQPLAPDARALLAQTAQRERIVFLNKADLGEAGVRESEVAGAISGSVLDPATVATIKAAIARIGWGGETPDLARPHLAALYELDAVNAALDAVERARQTLRAGEPVDFVASDLQRAMAELGHITGDAASEELIDAIFARFCIGK
jgi:tRNA modification GTPase